MADDTWHKDLAKVTFPGRGEFVGASFRGVPFFVESSERTGGRRVVVHEFPGRDKPFVEDLGQRAGTFRVEGYVIGDDYVAQRNALRVALEETEGPGELVHPYHGRRTAICTNLSVRETRTEGRMATFAIEFADAPAQAATPTIEVDAPSRVAAAADTAVTATKAELSERFDPKGLPAFALASAESALSRAADALGAKLARVVSGTQELAQLSGRVQLLAAQAASLVRQPVDVLDQFRGAIADLADAAASSPGAVMDALLEAYDVDLSPVALETTATRRRERANQLALGAALQRVIAIEAARLAPRVPYASIEDAIAARDRIAELLERQAAAAGDTAYPALVTLRSEVLQAVPGAAVFARLITITQRTPIPLTVLVYQLYGPVVPATFERLYADLIARNNIRHPGFVVGELKVLSDAG